MFTAKEHILNAIDLMAMLASIPGYTFILVVNLKDWINTKKIGATDQLITGISITSLLKQLMDFTNLGFYINKKENIYNGNALKPCSAFYLTLLLCNIWFSSWLCIYFCLKIVKINKTIYIYLQRTFHKMLPWLTITSIIGSMLVGASVFLEITHDSSLPTNQTLYISNKTICLPTVPRRNTQYVLFIATYCLGSQLFSASAVTIIISLYRHVKRMKANAEGPRRLGMEAHVQALQSMTLVLALNIIFCIVLMLKYFKEMDLGWMKVLTVMISICHFLDSVTIIKGNRKLEKTMLSIVTCLRTCNNPTTT